MTGRYNGCVATCKKQNQMSLPFTVLLITNIWLQRKTSVIRLRKSLHTVNTAVNKIKSHTLNDRLFTELCVMNDEDLEHLMLHT
jgi:hypothetical protein